MKRPVMDLCTDCMLVFPCSHSTELCQRLFLMFRLAGKAYFIQKRLRLLSGCAQHQCPWWCTSKGNIHSKYIPYISKMQLLQRLFFQMLKAGGLAGAQICKWGISAVVHLQECSLKISAAPLGTNYRMGQESTSQELADSSTAQIIVLLVSIMWYVRFCYAQQCLTYTLFHGWSSSPYCPVW